MPSQVLRYPGKRSVWRPGLPYFACMWFLMGSFLVTAGLSSSVIVKLFSAKELILEAPKWDRMGTGFQSPNTVLS